MGGKVSAAILEEAQAGSVKYSPEPAAGVYQRRLPGNGLRGGGNYTLVISDIPEMGWKLASCVKTHSLTAGFNRVASLMLAVIGGLFLLYASFSRFFLQSIIRPVHTMVEGLRQVEEGNLETHIEPAGQAEIRQMIHSPTDHRRNGKENAHRDIDNIPVKQAKSCPHHSGKHSL